MSRVFEFDPHRLTGCHGGRFRALQCLNARHLIHADRVRMVLEIQVRRLQVGLANELHLFRKQLWIFLRGVEPILAAMRLEFGLGQITLDLTGRN